MDVISSTAFGIKVDSQTNPNHPMMVAGSKIVGVDQENGITTQIGTAISTMLFCKGNYPSLGQLSKVHK